ncbi:MAG TPA: alanine racemase [Bacillota bacterium]|nr:alanine racemase [Bacillota bacterium]
MNKITYPILEVDLAKLENNVRNIYERCHKSGIKLCAVVKGFTARPEMVKAVVRGGFDQLGTSRLSHIRSMKALGIEGPFMLLRIPQLCDLEEIAENVHYSLQSEMSVMEALNEVCARVGKKHKVVLMFDLGDLREGYWDKAEGIADAVRVEKELECLELAGIGVNLGCYGSIKPTVEKMNELIEIASEIESAIGRKLEIVSGGATSSFGMVDGGVMPPEINHLRMGEALSCLSDLPLGDITYVPDYIKNDLLTVKAQIVEIKFKATKPRGVLFRDAFGNTPEYPDYGDRMRAIVALGRHDIAEFNYLTPLEEGIKILGGSSDHMILDVEDCRTALAVGDILSFRPGYGGQMFSTCTPDMNIVYK